MALKLPVLPPSFQPVLLAVGFALLVLVGGTSVWLVRQTDADSARALQTLEIKEEFARLQGLVWRAESNQRSFLMAGDQKYREAFQADIEAIGTTVLRLDDALGQADEQTRAALSRLKEALSAELSLLESTAAERGRDGRRAPVSGLLERSRAEDIRTMIGQLVQQEQRVLAGELAASNWRARQFLAASLCGILLIILLAAASIAIVRRSTGRMMAAQKALKQANESLEETVARRTAELRQANEEIQNFAYVVSHDLRAPLVNVMGFTSELEVMRKELFDRQSAAGTEMGGEDTLSADFDEALHFIKSSIARMDRLIKAILKLTREGRREFHLERIDMTELVRSIAEGLGYQAQMKGARITVEPLPSVHGDRLALEQVFGNLLDNALKYLREDTPGQIRVTGRATPTALVYEVQDNGRGIEEKDLGRIFDIFRRSGPQDRPGEGIGLTHVRTLVRRLGGSITVRSEPRQGSTFVVTFPSRPPASASETNP